jgi:hypothetical protein
MAAATVGDVMDGLRRLIDRDHRLNAAVNVNPVSQDGMGVMFYRILNPDIFHNK